MKKLLIILCFFSFMLAKAEIKDTVIKKQTYPKTQPIRSNKFSYDYDSALVYLKFNPIITPTIHISVVVDQNIIYSETYRFKQNIGDIKLIFNRIYAIIHFFVEIDGELYLIRVPN